MTPEYRYATSRAVPVQLLAQHTLWGQELAEVYAPSLGHGLTLPADDLLPLADAPLPSREELLVTLAAARIRAALNDGTLLAPLTANVTPLPHQLAALRRALDAERPRLLLADEVGLGKTIEAGLIMREFKLRGIVRRTLVVAPTGLTGQWQHELLTHFNETFHLLAPADFPTACSVMLTIQHQPHYYDLFRLENGLIVEHWDVIASIPPQNEWANDNGKF